MKPIDIEAALAQLRQEYLDGAGDRLEQIDALITRMRKPHADRRATFLDLQRAVHTLKGTAGSYGFPTIGRIAHRLEDYIETAGYLEREQLDDVQGHIDRIREIFDLGREPAEDEAALILRRLPSATGKAHGAASAPGRAEPVEVLLVLPKGVQRTIIVRELAAMGLRVTMAENGIHGLEAAVAARPDVVCAGMELPDITGRDLAAALRAVEATKAIRFVLMTSHDARDPRLAALPAEAAVIHKDRAFAGRLRDRLIAWGLDPDAAATAG